MKNDNHMNSFSSMGGGVAIKNKSERKQKVYFKVKLLRKNNDILFSTRISP